MMCREQLLALIRTVFVESLGTNLIGVILTGSAGLESHNEHSDIDYVILVGVLVTEDARRISEANAVLKRCMQLECSLSVATWEMIARLNSGGCLELDPKIVQAILQCGVDDFWLVDGFRLPKIELEITRRFSLYNFFSVKQLLIKTLVRSSTKMTVEEKIKILKLNKLLLKMYWQTGSSICNYFERTASLDQLKATATRLFDDDVRSLTMANLAFCKDIQLLF